MLGTGTILFLRAHPLPHWDIRGGPRSSAPPTRDRPQANSHYHAGDFDGIDAPWALSALPECLIQQSEFRAIDIAGLAPHMPKSAQRVAPGTRLTYRNCTIEVRAKDARVFRGPDRFHIPPLSQFYTTDRSLIFVRKTTDGHGAELRIYTASKL